MKDFKMANFSPPKPYKVHSLERGVDLIEILADKVSEKSLTELSKAAGFNLSTTHRILNALKSRGYVEQNPTNSRYKLTFKFFEIGNLIVRRLNFREEAVPVLTGLAEKTGESAHLIILDHNEALCIERIEGHHHIRVLFLQTGSRMPLHVGAGPRVLLAHLPEEEIDRVIKSKGLPAWTKRTITDPEVLKKDLAKIREQGYALSFEDATEDVASVGCPVRQRSDEVIAAISIGGISTHFTEDKLSSLIKMVKDAAYELSRRLNAPS